MSRIWIAFGTLVTVASLGWATFGIVSIVAHEEVVRSETFAAEGITRLELRNDNGTVEVLGVDPDLESGAARIQVDAEVDHGLRRTTVTTERRGDRLVIETDCPTGPPIWCSVDLRISVPADLRVDARNQNGRMTLRDLTGPVLAHTSNGPVELVRVTSDAIDVSSSNGPIRSRALGSARVTARTSNGPIDLEFTDPPTTVEAHTSNGPVEIVVPDDGTSYRLDLDTSFVGSTDSAVRTDPSSDRVLVARTSNGSITVRYPTG